MRARRIAEPALLALLALLACVPLVAMLRHAAARDLVFAGADGPFAADQFQYMSWIREYGSGLLAANDLDTAPSDRVFLHPMFLLSGLASAAGASAALAYLLWKPVAVVVLFLGFRTYVRRFLGEPAHRLAALALALFFASPVAAAVWWGSLGSESQIDDMVNVAGESLPATLLWGYLPSAISVGLMPLFLLGTERLVREGRDVRLVALVTACGAAASWLHPWQGEVLLVTVLVAVALERDLRRHKVIVAPVLGTAAPIAYYFVLSRFDDSWANAADVQAREPNPAIWIVALALLPLVAPACLGLRGVAVDLGERMLRLFPLAVLAVYLVLSPSVPEHAFEGVSLPLGILAVRGMARVRRSSLAPAALAVALTLPGLAFMLDWLEDTVSRGGQPHYLQRSESRALDYLDELDAPGAVLATPYLGPVVPAETGRRTWIGHPSWSRELPERVADADALFAGRLPRERALALVRSSRASFALRDCGRPAAALDSVRPVVVEERRFGCAAVYRIERGATG